MIPFLIEQRDSILFAQIGYCNIVWSSVVVAERSILFTPCGMDIKWLIIYPMHNYTGGVLKSKALRTSSKKLITSAAMKREWTFHHKYFPIWAQGIYVILKLMLHIYIKILQQANNFFGLLHKVWMVNISSFEWQQNHEYSSLSLQREMLRCSHETHLTLDSCYKNIT